MIVQWAPSADHSDRVDARNDAEVDFQSDLGNRSFQLVEVEPGQTVSRAVRSLERDPAVAVAERDGYRAPNAIPDDPLFDQLWGLQNTGIGIGGFVGAIAGADINAVGAWTSTVGTPTTVVADIDSGYRFEHPDLANVAWTNPAEAGGSVGADDDENGIVDDIHGADFIGSNGDAPSTDGDPTDDDLISGGHGVHTAGTIGAQGNNSVGITGVAQDVRIMPLRVCSRFPTKAASRCQISSVVAAINYANEKGARVVNMSLGGTDGFQTEVNAIAAAKETLFVISAGNDGSNNDLPAAAPHGHHYPCDYTPQTQAEPAVPGAIDNIVCVAATDQADDLAGFSDWGPVSVDLGAPGTQTLSTYPTSNRYLETFEVDDFATKWTATGADGGFGRTNEAPLTSFGISDTPAEGPVENTVRESTSAPFVLPSGLGSCRLIQRRNLSVGTGNSYSYAVLLDGDPIFSSGSVTASGIISTVPITALDAGGEVQVVERYAVGSTTLESTNGAWIDDITLRCYEPADSNAATYEFLQGTSMAAPHVTGAAALLFSLKPSASVSQVKSALLSSVDPVPALNGKTTTGGRLDVSSALDALEVAPPDAPQLTSTVPLSPARENHPKIVGSAEAESTVRIYLGAKCAGSAQATGTAEELSSPGIAVSVSDSSTTQFSATATDAALHTSSCSKPLAYTEDTPFETEVVEPPPDSEQTPLGPTIVGPPVLPVCKVPKLAGKTLGQAKAALTVAHCTLGTVSKPKAKRGRKRRTLVVRSSAPAAGAQPANGKVNLSLGPKPKPKKHPHR